MKYFASTLRHKIFILAKEDDFWKEEYFCFASIKDYREDNLLLHENIDFGSIISKNYKIIRTRFLKNISKNMRIKFKNKQYEILKITNEKEESKITRILVSEI